MSPPLLVTAGEVIERSIPCARTLLHLLASAIAPELPIRRLEAKVMGTHDREAAGIVP
jgi:hypothetical protein